MPITNNKDIIKSYILTTSRYHFTAAEVRVMTQIVNLLQSFVEGNKLEGRYSLTEDLLGYRRITMPISVCLKHGEDKNYHSVKKALLSLQDKVIEYEDDKRWEAFNIIHSPIIEKGAESVQFDLHWRMYDAFLNYTKGYRELELLKMMQLDSVYSMRFYELLSGQKKPIDYTIDNLRIMFKLEGKYKQSRDFIKKTVAVAKAELDKRSPWTFDYEVIKKGRKMHKIRFYPKFQPEHRDQELEERKLRKNASVHWDMSPPELHYLKNQYGFDEKGIKNNMKLFIACKNKGLSLVDEFAEVFPRASKADNPQGYLIGVLKRKIK